MELTVRSRDLVKELAFAQGVAEAKNTIPILGNVLIEARDDALHIAATDLELGVRSSCSANVTKEGATTVPMRMLFDYVKLLPDAELKITVNESDSMALHCATAKTRLAGIDRKNFPELAEMPEPMTSVPAEALSVGLARTLVSVATERSHYAIAGALLVLRHDEFGLVSTDGHRLSLHFEKRTLSGIEEEVTNLLPRKTMTELLKIADGEESGSKEDPTAVEFATDEKHMFFRCGPRLLISQKLAGKFPDYQRVLPKELGIMLELERETFHKALQRVALFSDERSRAVQFDLEEGKLQLKATISDYASEESIPVEYKGEPFGVGFNSLYIIEFLQTCERSKVQFKLQDPRGAAQLEVAGDDKNRTYLYVIMPVRV